MHKIEIIRFFDKVKENNTASFLHVFINKKLLRKSLAFASNFLVSLIFFCSRYSNCIIKILWYGNLDIKLHMFLDFNLIPSHFQEISKRKCMTSETFCIHMQLHPCIACATLSASLMSNEVRRSEAAARESRQSSKCRAFSAVCGLNVPR